jgi:hypothetical protein
MADPERPIGRSLVECLKRAIVANPDHDPGDLVSRFVRTLSGVERAYLVHDAAAGLYNLAWEETRDPAPIGTADEP